MTKIFKFESPERGELAQPVYDDDWEVFRTLDGTARAATWTPIRMKLVREDEGCRFAESDFPWLGSYAPIMRKRAREALGDIASRYGELLPLVCDDAELCVLNVCTVTDALDVERSTISYYSSSDKIMWVDAYVFRPEALQGVQIFKIPQQPRAGTVFVNEDVVDLVQQAGLAEVGFRLLWDGADPERAAFSIDDIFTRMLDDG